MSTEFTVGGDWRLSAAAVRAACAGSGRFWRDIDVVPRTGSTNADMLETARRGAPEGTVLVAEAQTAGRGRLGRSWVTSPGAALTFSVLLRPAAVPAGRRGWVPLLTGVSVACAVQEVAVVAARLKWPNDVLAGGAKLAGILAEQAGGAIVVGIGINVTATAAQLPSAGATSLALQRASCIDRELLLAGLLRRVADWYLRWSGSAGDPVASGLRQEYLRLSATVGRDVRVSLPGGRMLSGTATGIDDAGRLLVAVAGNTGARNAGAGEVTAVSAGDVIHIR